MKIRLVAYGIAKDILNARNSEIEVNGSGDIASLKNALLTIYPIFANLRSLSFAVGEEYRTDDYQLNDGDEVVIIPPVSGG